MKKYNKANQNTLLLGIVLPILVFLLSMSAVYAYFTATSNKTDSTATGILTISFSSETNATLYSNTISETTKILPGETFIVNSTIENTGNIDVFVIVELKIEATKFGETTKQLIETKYYSFNEQTAIEIIEIDEETYSATAIVLEAPNSAKTNAYSHNFSIPYTINFNDFGNEYENGSITYTLTGYAIQKAYIEDATVATRLLLNRTTDE